MFHYDGWQCGRYFYFSMALLFMAQTALVRMRKVGVHRMLGWFGAALARTMVVSSFSVSVVMLRFDRTVHGLFYPALDALIVAGILRGSQVASRNARDFKVVKSSASSDWNVSCRTATVREPVHLRIFSQVLVTIFARLLTSDTGS